MKNSLTNPVKYNKIIIPEAIFVTVLIHFLFFILFTPPSIKTEGSERENPTVTMLRFSPTNEDTVEVYKYIEKYAPTHFAAPRSKSGFNTFHRTPAKKFTSLSDLSAGNVPLSAPPPVIPRAPLPPEPDTKRPLPRSGFAVSSKIAHKNIEYPCAISDSGIIIPLTFSTNEQQMIKEFPLETTICKLFYDRKNNLMPRLMLIRSCGRRTLDKISTKMLYQEISKLSNCSEGELFTIYYSKPDGGTTI